MSKSAKYIQSVIMYVPCPCPIAMLVRIIVREIFSYRILYIVYRMYCIKQYCAVHSNSQGSQVVSKWLHSTVVAPGQAGKFSARPGQAGSLMLWPVVGSLYSNCVLFTPTATWQIVSRCHHSLFVLTEMSIWTNYFQRWHVMLLSDYHHVSR